MRFIPCVTMEGESGDSSKSRDITEETTVNNFAGTEIKTVSRLAEQADDLAERRRELALQKEQYYARFQGGECSSDEEQDDPNSTDEQEMNDDEKMGVNQYTMLSDEFGDFVSADDANSGEEFADFSSNTVSVMTLGENPPAVADDGPDVDSEVIEEAAPPAPVVPSIAPFSKGSYFLNIMRYLFLSLIVSILNLQTRWIVSSQSCPISQ